jgi:hypothetical protein
VVSLWQAGDELEVTEDTLDANGQPTGTAPPGATGRLLACEGQPLAFEVV